MPISLSIKASGGIAQAGGKIYIRTTDGKEWEFSSVQDIRNYASGIDSESALDTLLQLVLRWYFLHDPDLTNPAILQGKTITLDLSKAANAIFTVA